MVVGGDWFKPGIARQYVPEGQQGSDQPHGEGSLGSDPDSA